MIDEKTSAKLNELRQKGAKEYKVGPNSKLEEICEAMCDLADIETRTYKANFRGTTFYVYPDDDTKTALRSYAEAALEKDDKKMSMHRLREIQEDSYFGKGIDGIFASVVVEKIINQYPEEVDKISPIALLNAYYHNDGFLGNGKYSAAIKPLLDGKIENYMNGEENIPMTIANMKNLRYLRAYINTMLDADGEPRFEKASHARTEATEKAFLKKITNDLTSDDRGHLFTRSALPIYMLAKKHNDNEAMDAIAGSVSPVLVMKRFGFDHYDTMDFMDTSEKVEAMLLFKRAVGIMMNGKDIVNPRSMQDILDINKLCRFMEKGYKSGYSSEQIYKRQEELQTKYLDNLLKDPKEMDDFKSGDYKILAHIVEDIDNPKYADLGKKAAAECARLSKLENSGKGPNG